MGKISLWGSVREITVCTIYWSQCEWINLIKDDYINHDIYPGSSTHCEVVFREVLHPDRIRIWKCWFLGRGENRSTRRKTSQSRVENHQQTHPTYDVESGNRARATLVGGEYFHHCAIPAPQTILHQFSGHGNHIVLTFDYHIPRTLVGVKSTSVSSSRAIKIPSDFAFSP